MDTGEKKKTLKENIFREGNQVEGLTVKGYDFNDGVEYSKIIESFTTTGFQARNLAEAIKITNKMIKEDVSIYLGYTSNLVSSGLRDILRYIVEHKRVHVIVTTTGGVEEDIMKCLGDFKIGDFRADGSQLREKGINRIGNIFVSNSEYVKFESFVQPILHELWKEQQKTGKSVSSTDLIWKLGEKINNKESICYWAWKHAIPLICPAIGDGALGDNIYFFTLNHPDFAINVVKDITTMNDTSFNVKKTGAIILGSGVVKHHILNTNMLRNGAEYVVYINTAQEFDGSDAGASPEEAISWGKIKKKGEHVKVHGDATIIFPLLVAETFAKKT